MFQSVAALVHDLVDSKRRGGLVGVRQVVGGQGFGDFDQPLFQLLGRAGIERGHGTDHTGNTLRNNELGCADDEQRRADYRERQVRQGGREFGHGGLVWQRD